ncbi:MAG: hypothetical protein C4539_18500, partial [Ignavibacteriales bacterium]
MKIVKPMFAMFVMLLLICAFSTITIADTHYVVHPTSIQTAINAATDGDIVLVGEGTYYITSALNITKAITVVSENGPEVTIIHGQDMCCCFYMNNTAAILDGFSITHGRNTSGFGGGVQCDNGTVQNCIITENRARDGGGVALNNSGLVLNCIIKNNIAEWGGGVRCFNGTVRNCLITENTANPHGGGINIWSGGTVQNCTIVNNTATDGAGIRLWNNGIVENSIIYFNDGDNYIITAGHGNSLSYCCTYPAYAGTGNTDADPLFENFETDYRLTSASPIIDAGLDAAWMTTAFDLDGNDRILYDAVDIGAYEYKISYEIGGPVPIASWPVGNPTIYTNPPTLNWYLGVDATGLSYEIQYVVASDSWPADDVLVTSSSLSYIIPAGLTAGVQYCWRVRSTNGVQKSNWSTTAYFTMAGNTAGGPVIPTASWPVGNPTIYTNPPTLNWYLGADGTGLSYEIQ